jgi:hypothetical protein
MMAPPVTRTSRSTVGTAARRSSAARTVTNSVEVAVGTTLASVSMPSHRTPSADAAHRLADNRKTSASGARSACSRDTTATSASNITSSVVGQPNTMTLTADAAPLLESRSARLAVCTWRMHAAPLHLAATHDATYSGVAPHERTNGSDAMRCGSREKCEQPGCDALHDASDALNAGR